MVKVKAKGPAQVTVLSRDVAVLRKLNMKKIGPGLYDILAKTNLEPGIQESQVSWFDEGYVSNDHPRDAMVSHALIDATTGFAVARTDTGEIMAKFAKDQLAEADRVAASAKIKLDINVDLTASDEDDEDLEDDDESAV